MDIIIESSQYSQINPSEVVTPFVEQIGYMPTNIEHKRKGLEIAQVIVSKPALNDVGFIPK